MRRQTLVLVALTAVALAGCLAGPGTGPGESGPADGNESAPISSESVPGVTNGSLDNATELALANEERLTAAGGVVRVNQSTASGYVGYRLDVGTGFATYGLAGTRQAGDDRTQDIALWANESTQISRTTADGEHSYRASDRRDDSFDGLETVERYLAAGDFTVANESNDGTIVLEASEYAPSADRRGPFTDVTSFSGRLVVDESGLIHNLTATVTSEEESLAYRYELLRTGVDRVSRPDWLEDVPPGALVQPELTVDVEDSAYLTVRNEGGDPVPRDTVLSLTTDGATHEVTFQTALEPGETRYAYVDADDETLKLAADRPTADAVDPISSPISLTVTTDGGATLYSGGMAWDSGSASENATESGGSAGESGSNSS